MSSGPSLLLKIYASHPTSFLFQLIHVNYFETNCEVQGEMQKKFESHDYNILYFTAGEQKIFEASGLFKLCL